jgi:hypothetical protein
MRRLAALGLVAGALVAASMPSAGGALAAPALHECQKPVRTGVEVYDLRNVARAQACHVALALFAWENDGRHWSVLYGCHRPQPDAVGYPYLRLHSFHGWRLSLRGRPYGEFRMSRAASSFLVTGTDFPLNCT